ncbi:MAG: tetratricopeptide repeat protein [bacterium]
MRNDIVDADVYYYYGLSLLAVDRDYESIDRFSKAVGMDSSLAGPVAEHLETAAVESFRTGRRKQAGVRLMAAADFAPDADFGVYSYALADAYFAQKEYPEAARFYEAALAQRPDTSTAETACFNLAESYLALGDSAAAVTQLERQLADFPRGELATQAEWNLVNLLCDRARSELERGNYEAVQEIVSGLLERTDNISVIQRARFILGESYEGAGDYGNAYEQYKAIIKEDRGASGRIVERARARIEAFRDAGVI